MHRQDGDTTLGGAGRDFPSTVWSSLIGARGGDPERRRGLQMLAQDYWKPVYVYIRSKWARSNEDAKDLTQDFFAWMFETDFVSRVNPHRGRFRGFLKVALEHYLVSDERKSRAQKRGGDVKVLALEGTSDEMAGWSLADPAGRAPEALLDEAWRAEVFRKGVELLEAALRREGKEAYFRVFQEYVLSDSAEVDYRQVAERVGIPQTSVSNFLKEAKSRFQEAVAELVAQTVSGPEDLKEEIRQLFGGGGSP